MEQALIIMYPNICAIIMLYYDGSLVPNCILCVQDELAVLGSELNSIAPILVCK